jgi:hypothetical protein
MGFMMAKTSVVPSSTSDAEGLIDGAAKLARLELNQQATSTRLDHLDVAVEKIYTGLNSLTVAVNNLQSTKGSVQWSNLIVSAGSVFVAVFGFLTFYNAPMSNRLSAVEALSSKTAESGSLQGQIRQAVQEAKITNMGEDVKSLEDAQQKRLNDEADYGRQMLYLKASGKLTIKE